MYNSHSIVFIHWLIAFYGYGVIAQPPGKEHSPVVGKGTDTQWVSNAISGIYITDVIFHFNNDIHRYEIKTEKCSEHIELYFDVPLWKETFQPDINSNDIPKSVNNVTSRIKGKGNEKTNSVMDQINEVLITSPKNRANSGTINYVNPADLIRFNSDKPSNSQPFSTVNVIINGENLDPEDGGYILVPVHCGNKHELMIDIEYTQELIISKARYNIVLDVPIFGNNNILKVLSISKSGIIYTYQPSLSRFHNLYVVSGYHSPGDIINIYVECKYGMPIYNGKELNQLSIILDESILLSHIEIVCDDVVQNDIKVVDKHLYTLKFQKELQEEIKPPTNVMVVHDSLNCKKYKEGGDCVISCPFVKKRFGPLIIDTDPTYRYFIHRLNIIEGYVSELHGHNAGYMKVCSGIVTPIFDLQRNILIYGIHGEKSKTFILSANRNDIPAVTFYQTILDIFIFSTYIMGIVVTTLPYLLRTYKGVIFDKMPMTVDSLVYLAQLLCVYNKYSHRKINEHHMLPNIGMDDKFPTFRTMLLYIYAITASIISSSMQSLKKPNIYKSITDKFKFNRSPHGLSDALFYLFIFSWIFDSLSTISAMLFGGYDPIISIIYITPRGRLAIKLSKWLSHLHYIYSVLGITVAIVALQYAFRRIMLSLKIKWAALQNKKYKWILNIGNFENAISDYSYYEDDDDDRLYTEISGKHSKLTEGYWMDVTCDFLTTQYSDTFTSRKFNLFNRKYAVIAAQVNEVDLSKVEESLYEDKWDSQSQLNTSLNETTQPLGENIPERVRIMRRKNSAASKLTAKGIETTFSNPPTPEIRKKNMRWSYGISQDYTVDIQIDYILQIDSSFYHKTIGTVDSRYIRYFITWNFLKRTSRFITAITMNKVLKLRSMLQVTVKQLLNSDSIEDCDSTKNVKIYLFRESVNTFKAISSILTVVTFTFSSKSAFYLGILHIVIHMILSLTFLAKPFCNSVDNHISLICMTTGTVILMFPELTVVHSNWNKIICIILILLSIYGMITSIFLIIDTAFIWCLPQCNDNDECNTIVVVKDANDNIVGIIHGSCKIEISTSILTLDEEYGITLNTRVKEGQLPTIVVSLEHIDTSSLYIPFITIANMSNLGDSICVNECQANQSYLRRHISTKFEDRIAHLLVRNILRHVNQNTEVKCFCFYIAL